VITKDLSIAYSNASYTTRENKMLVFQHSDPTELLIGRDNVVQCRNTAAMSVGWVVVCRPTRQLELVFNVPSFISCLCRNLNIGRISEDFNGLTAAQVGLFGWRRFIGHLKKTVV